MLELSPSLRGAYSDIEEALVKGGIAAGVGARDVADAIQASGVNKAYHKLERFARTEMVSAYWKKTWDEAEGTGLSLLWQAEEGPRCCTYCKAKEGLVVTDKNLRDHPNGRCTLVPVDLDDGLDDPVEGVIPDIPEPSTPLGKHIRSRWQHSYTMTQYWRENWSNPEAPPFPEYDAPSGVSLPKNVSALMSEIAADFHALGQATRVWRAETSSLVDRYPMRGAVIEWTAPSAVSVNEVEAASRIGAVALPGDQTVVWVLRASAESRGMPGNIGEGELIMMAGSRVLVEDIEERSTPSGEVVYITGIVYPPAVGGVYYTEGSRKLTESDL